MYIRANLDNERFYLKLIKQGKLRVTKKGRAFNLESGREIGLGKSGYRKLSWMHPKTGKIVQVQLHRLVWAKYRGLEDPNIEINHLDGKKQNCCLSNLEATTSSGNNQHAVDIGLRKEPRGEQRPNAVFSDKEVARYRRQYAEGRVTMTEIADNHKTSTTTVSYMLRRKTYTHI